MSNSSIPIPISVQQLSHRLLALSFFPERCQYCPSGVEVAENPGVLKQAYIEYYLELLPLNFW